MTALFRGYSVEMPPFPNLSDDEIRSILVYVDSQPLQISGFNSPGSSPFKPDYWLYAVIAMLIIIIFILLRTNLLLLRHIRELMHEPVPEGKKLHEILTSKKFILIVFMVLTFVITYQTSISAMRMGLSKNYQPEQPIAFSHRIHAGIAQINCLYCHAGAEKSRTAGIPSVGTCMNCHRAIRGGEDEEQTRDIEKLLYAYNNDKPLAWTRIHNLPDHVYFNHSQHVAVGLIDCQTCHGPVEQMDQVYQFASLSMGWCVNCHRGTVVQLVGNDYYKMFDDLQKQVRSEAGIVKDSGKVHITEAMLGGTECQRCHY